MRTTPYSVCMGGNYVFFLLRLVVNAFCLCRMDLQIHAQFSENWSQTGAGVPPGGPGALENGPRAPRALQETPRDGQKASRIASGSALEALRTRCGTIWGAKWGSKWSQNCPQSSPKWCRAGSLMLTSVFMRFFKDFQRKCCRFSKIRR